MFPRGEPLQWNSETTRDEGGLDSNCSMFQPRNNNDDDSPEYWKRKAAEERGDLQLSIINRKTDWMPMEPRKNLTPLERRVNDLTDKDKRLLAPFVPIDSLNQAERLDTFKTPQYPELKKYKRRQARRCKNNFGEKKARTMANYKVTKKESFSNALKITVRRRDSLVVLKMADPTLVKKTTYQEYMLQAADNIIIRLVSFFSQSANKAGHCPHHHSSHDHSSDDHCSHNHCEASYDDQRPINSEH
ncbi:hypothetical protein Fcan01_11745 [Folsomia candida]|uniref:Uncharacterized protein n=1 Tax=Folsomia candida TaxID=158441 RepID=A0A226EC36_FOLCA|nr:hypothetical protein Fcan01_11745 [Folsomia candida]